MDTSREYIKMCDCPEIRDMFNAITEADHKRKVETDKWTKDTKYSVRIPDIRTANVYIYGEDSRCLRSVELLSQDQIQEMMIDLAMDESVYNWKCHTPTMKLFALFINFCEINGAKYKTFEQLWLAFYMFEEHDKIWDGKRWK